MRIVPFMSIATLFQKQTFAGDKKHLVHFLVPYEKKLIAALLPVVPAQMSTVHLTLMTVLWSIVIIAAGYLAQHDMRWMALFSAGIFLQYVTDMLDGAVGRLRGTGLIKWGFYMDHFLDFIFLCSIITGYSFLLPASFLPLVLLCLACCAGFMVHAFLDFAITNNFKISVNEFGVSEARMALILFNIGLIFTGKDLLVSIFPFFVTLACIALCAVVYNSQKTYGHIDAMQQATTNEEVSYG